MSVQIDYRRRAEHHEQRAEEFDRLARINREHGAEAVAARFDGYAAEERAAAGREREEAEKRGQGA